MDNLLHPVLAFLAAGSDTAAHLPLALLLVFGTAKLLAEIFERFGQPGIVGEILAGVLLGPSVLHWVEPDQLMASLAEMGAMFLLFRVGLDVKAADLAAQAGRRRLQNVFRTHDLQICHIGRIANPGTTWRCSSPLAI